MLRVSLSELNFRLSHLLPAGKRITSVLGTDGMSIECELGDKPDTRHPFKPNAKYSWFCGVCGYPEHEVLMHLPPNGQGEP